MDSNQRVVTIFGTSKAVPGDEVYELAFEIGKILAEKGYTIANGGYGGTMLASARGANMAGGKVIGVTCSAFGRSGANAFVTEEIKTATLTERLGKLVDLGDGYIVLPGGTGTLLELAEVWEMKNKKLSNPEKPIIIAGCFWEGLLKLMDSMDKGCIDCIIKVERIEQIPEILLQV